MFVSDKLATEIFTIEVFHLIAIIAALGVMIYFWLKARRSALLYSFLLLVGMLLVWMISKVFKTVSPNEGLRWFFIVTQYLGIEFCGYFFLVFALIYTRRFKLNKKIYFLLALPPAAAFLVVITNPLHMQFYSYFDFYKDSFGPLFFPTQAVLYAYLLSGILLLSAGFTRQAQFKNHKLAGRLLALTIMVPIGCNAYYLLVKLTDIPFVLNIPFFDFTPITSTFALIIFILPAFRYRFLDIIPFAYRNVYDQLPDGMGVLGPDGLFTMENGKFANLSADTSISSKIKESIAPMAMLKRYELELGTNAVYSVFLSPVPTNGTFVCLTDITEQTLLKDKLRKTNDVLFESNKRLTAMLEMVASLSALKIKTQIAQDVHDIFGHTLIVVLGLLDLALKEEGPAMQSKLSQAKELLKSGVLDLQLALDGQDRKKTTLEKSILSLSNEAITLDLTVQGKVEELNSQVTESLFRICQEAATNAIKHGKATLISIILRFKTETVEIYIIDNGTGCKAIKKNYGLSGMDRRIKLLAGEISYGSDGENGFIIHLVVPRSGFAPIDLNDVVFERKDSDFCPVRQAGLV